MAAWEMCTRNLDTWFVIVEEPPAVAKGSGWGDEHSHFGDFGI